MITSRRSFIAGIAAAFAAPAIVKASSLMPVKALERVRCREIYEYNVYTDEVITRLDILYGHLNVRAEWSAFIPDLTMDDYSKRILSPMMNKLADQVAADIMNGGAADDAFFSGQQWDKVWLNEAGLIEKETSKPPLVYRRDINA